MQIQPYLFFDGRCQEAIDFYQAAVGAEVTALLHYEDHPEMDDPDACLPPDRKDDSVMHGSLRIGDTQVMVSDGHCGGKPAFEGFALSLTAADPAEAGKLFAALAEAGTVVMPLGKTFFSPCFGMATDRFGVSWMVYVAP